MKTKKIKFVRKAMFEPFNRGESVGTITELDVKLANDLIKAKLVIPAEEKESGLPEDIPAREILVGLNFNSVEEVKAIDDLTKLNGISAVLADKIKAYLEEDKES
jgi:sporulation protein YlmC with PRC-barrel domain